MKDELSEISNRLDRIEEILVDTEDELVNMTICSKFTGLSKNTIYKYISEQSLPVYKFGRLLRFKKSELRSWMLNRIEQQSQSIAK
jgi:excisionase family DNA binding protein